MTTATQINPSELAAVPFNPAGKSRKELIAMREKILECRAQLREIEVSLREEAGMLPDAVIDDASILNSRMGLSVKTRELAMKIKAIRHLGIIRIHIEHGLRDDHGPTPAPKWINEQIEPLKRVARGLLHRQNTMRELLDKARERRPLDDAHGLKSWRLGFDKLLAESDEIAAELARVQGEMGQIGIQKLTAV